MFEFGTKFDAVQCTCILSHWLEHFLPGVKDGDPGSPPVITLNLSNHGRLHRPVPVHMSRLAEKDTEEEEEEEDEGEEGKNAVEINRNYKQYVKATRVPQKQEEEQHDPDEEEEKGSSSSATSTPRGENCIFQKDVCT